MIDLKLSWKLRTSARQGYGPKYELGNVTKEPNNLARCQALNNHQNGCSVCHTACLCYSLDDYCLSVWLCDFSFSLFRRIAFSHAMCRVFDWNYLVRFVELISAQFKTANRPPRGVGEPSYMAGGDINNPITLFILCSRLSCHQ